MRDLKTLYQLVLDNFDTYTITGICCKIVLLHEDRIISDKEYAILIEDFLSKRRIKWYSKFYWNKSVTNKNYWWQNNYKGNEQRKKYLQHIINKL